MKSNRFFLHKTRILIAGLLVVAILAVGFFAIPSGSFAANGKNTDLKKCTPHIKAAQAALQGATPNVKTAQTHLQSALACLPK